MFQAPVALERDDLRVGSQGNGRDLFDAANQISRHALRQSPGADQQMDAPGASGEEARGLPRRIASAHDDDLFALAEVGFHMRSSVVNTGPLELGKIGDRQPAVLGAGSDENGASLNRPAAGAFNGKRPALAIQAHGNLRDGYAGSKLLRLYKSAARQILAGDAGREPE